MDNLTQEELELVALSLKFYEKVVDHTVSELGCKAFMEMTDNRDVDFTKESAKSSVENLMKKITLLRAKIIKIIYSL